MIIKYYRYSLSALLVFFFTLSGCMNTGVGRQEASEPLPEPNQVEVFFTTNRAPHRKEKMHFSAERGDVSFGISQVGIPANHLMGRHEEPSLLKFEWEPNEHKHIRVNDVNTFPEEEFIERLAKATSEAPNQKVMVFIHGYNAEFTDATRVVAQFANDLKFNGPVVLYSWPSKGSLTSYTQDETNAEWATTHLVALLRTLLDKIPAKDIYLVSHSMGSRVLGHGVTALASDLPASYLSIFREIVMIAPDIDADVFRHEMAPRLARTGIHTTLYASSNDRALRLSKTFHGYPRAGDAGDGLVIVDGVETVDASGASGGLLGHSYFAEDRRIMEDIFALLQTGQRAENRFGLGAIEQNGERYWTFRK